MQSNSQINHKIDYLTELRNKREEEEGGGREMLSCSPQWIKRVMEKKGLGQREKIDLVRRNAEIMEAKAQMLE